MPTLPTSNIAHPWQRYYFEVQGRSIFKMESGFLINLIFIFVLNVFFFFSGVCLNSVVIISFWRSVQLRKKICYFIIMMLSCCDLLAVLTNNLWITVAAVLSMTEKLDVNAAWNRLTSKFAINFLAFSLLSLLVMNFDRYLATSYPLFHRTSVTKKKCLTFFAILVIIQICLALMSLNDFVISFQVHLLIFFVLVSPPMLFFNYKLLVVIRKSRRDRGVSPETKKKFSLKNVSSCLLAVACYVTLSIPVFVYVGLRINYTQGTLAFDHYVNLIGIWAQTITSMNPTINCIIFYWKNKVLRNEGLKVIKSIQTWRGIRA